MTEISSDSCENLNYRDPPSFLVSIPYQSWYQDRDLKSLDSSLNIKTQNLRVSISVSILRQQFQNVDSSLNPNPPLPPESPKASRGGPYMALHIYFDIEPCT